VGKKNAATLDANERYFGAFLVALGDFVGDAGQGAVHGGGVQNDSVMGRRALRAGTGICTVFHALATSLDRI
jgi:hypothetical protein